MGDPTMHPNAALALAVGAKAPGFALDNWDGVTFSLAEAVALAPLVLVFYRGDW